MALKTILNTQPDFTGEFPAEYAKSGLWRFNESTVDDNDSVSDSSGCGRSLKFINWSGTTANLVTGQKGYCARINISSPTTEKEEKEFDAATADEAMAYALEGTEWNVGTVTVSTKRTWTCSETNALSILRQVADLHGGDLVFDCPNRLVHLYTFSGTDSGALFSYQSIARYQCHYKVRHKSLCDGQSGYTVSILDKIVDEAIRTKFASIQAAPRSEILGAQHEKQLALAKSKVAQAKSLYAQKAKELTDLRAETLKVIRGESKLSAELLNSLVAETEAQAAAEEQNLKKAQDELDQLLASNAAAEKEYNQILSWADLYDQASFDAKKMIVSQLIRAVYVRRDYEVEIDFNISFDEELWQ